MTATDILYYRLEPVRAPDPADGLFISTTAMVQCMATGRYLDSSGGGCGMVLSLEIVDSLDMYKTGGGPRAVVDTADWDALRTALADLVGVVQNSSSTEEAVRTAEKILAATKDA